MRLGFTCLGMAVLLCGASSTTAKAARPVVAVFDIESRGARIKSSLSDNLVDHIETRLVSSGRFAVVPRSQVKQALRGQTKESYKECYEESCQIEVGKELAAEKTLATRISKIGSTCTVSLKLYDLRKSVAEAGRNGEGRCSPDGIFKALKSALKGMLGDAEVGTSVSISPSPSDDDLKKELARARAEEAKDKAKKEALRRQASKRWPTIRQYAQARRIKKNKRIKKLETFMARYGDNNPHRSEAEALLQKLQVGGAMVLVPAGKFYMGCNERVDSECDADEKPGKEVYVAAFRIDKTEVTVAQYKKCVNAGACSARGLTMPFYNGKEQPEWAHTCTWNKPGLDEHPINCIDWNQAKAYCKWAGKRLPTEKEWEKAARGTDERKYSWGNTRYGSQKVANIADETAKRSQSSWSIAKGYDDGYYKTAPVGSFPAGASPYGALDMIGNVLEWTSDWYTKGKSRAVRGGSWSLKPRNARSSYRSWREPGARGSSLGFRCSSSL